MKLLSSTSQNETSTSQNLTNLQIVGDDPIPVNQLVHDCKKIQPLILQGKRGKQSKFYPIFDNL